LVFWILAIAVTAVACAALYYAGAGRPVNATAAGVDDATTAHFRLQLKEIETDVAAGRMGEAEGVAAKAEMARELIRLKGEGRPAAVAGRQRALVLAALAATSLLAFGTYGMLGSPDQPSLPLAGRPEPQMTLADALARIEQQLTATPDDLRGWVAVAPVYMQTGRFAEAERAYRRVIELAGASAEAETDLAEALMMQQDGVLAGEPQRLLQSALARDPGQMRARYYLAGEATRLGEYQSAITQWNELIALASGDEPWLAAARNGLAAAEAGRNGESEQPAAADIAAMVEGLSARLLADGGSLAEWTQLVRSRLVLGETAAAQAAYDAARVAYPDAARRTELDVLAADNGLVAR
jgi:cytochrome c-type biogenesis protein CcmH